MAKKRSRARRSPEDKPEMVPLPPPPEDDAAPYTEPSPALAGGDAEIRTSSEILDERDRRRMDQEP